MEKALRLGILGCASIATEMVAAAAKSSKVSVVAVASRDRERAEAWAKKHDVPSAFGSYTDLLAADDLLDAVYVPLPNSLHGEWTLRALDAGLPVLCEKPLAPTAAEARAVAEAAGRRGLLVAEGFMYRHHPLYEEVARLLAKGVLGPLTSIDAEFTFMLDDWRSVSASADLGGGALLDVGCYCVHLARWAAGREPERVAAFAGLRDSVDASFHGLLQFSGGLVARLEAGLASAERHRVMLSGTEASLVIDRPWLQWSEETRLRICRYGSPDEIVTVPGADAYCLQVEAFADACRGRRPFPWPIGDAVNNLAVIDALFAAARSGVTQTLPAGAKESTGGQHN